jgi:hypothetical protein
MRVVQAKGNHRYLSGMLNNAMNRGIPARCIKSDLKSLQTKFARRNNAEEVLCPAS